MIIYKIGDATTFTERPAFIIHICNDVGAFSKGFVSSLSKRWFAPRKAYIESEKRLSTISVAKVEPELMVINMVAQHGIDYYRYVDLNALEKCLKTVNSLVGNYQSLVSKTVTIHCPRIGTGLGNCTWDKIEPILKRSIIYDIYVYDLQK